MSEANKEKSEKLFTWKCLNCGAKIKVKQKDKRPFKCPECGRKQRLVLVRDKIESDDKVDRV